MYVMLVGMVVFVRNVSIIIYILIILFLQLVHVTAMVWTASQYVTVFMRGVSVTM